MKWVRSNAAACKGLYDDISMNYFGDIADPYHGLLNYYRSIRATLDKLGERDVEIGSGESSFQWAEASDKLPANPPTSMKDFDPDKTPLCELKQAWRCNESLGTFFDEGGNKFVMWGTEYAPGGGWAWRWGLRKYQDWWGNWPESDKVPGANIVFGDDKDGKRIDLRPGWTSPQADPYHPIWRVFEFWAQATPPGSEAVRLPMRADSGAVRTLRLATYLRTADRCVALLQNDKPAPGEFSLDLAETGWPDGAPVVVDVRNQTIDYATGAQTTNWTKTIRSSVKSGRLALSLPELAGFTTLDIRRDRPEMDGEIVSQVLCSDSIVGKPIDCIVVLRNTGTSPWPAGQVGLALCGQTKTREWKIAAEVKAGEVATVNVQLPPADASGRVSYALRLRSGRQEFGPAFVVSAQCTDPTTPRKLVAFREFGHMRLKWFAPKQADTVDHYELYRAPGFGENFALVSEVRGTSYIDTELETDKAYYYRVVAVDKSGRKSRPSNEDNARASSTRRIWDAEITEHDVPERIGFGESRNVTVTIRNTGTKPWDPGDSRSRLFLRTTQQWGVNDEDKLPRFALGSGGVVRTGETVKVSFPLAAWRAGRYENHWVLCLEVEGQPCAYIGTPLLVETVVGSGE